MYFIKQNKVNFAIPLLDIEHLQLSSIHIAFIL